MKKFDIKSILLGIGIGIVMTSVISMIYIAGVNPNAKMSNEKIIEEAKKLGLVENTDLISKNKDNSAGEEKKPIENTPPTQEKNSNQPTRSSEISSNTGTATTNTATPSTGDTSTSNVNTASTNNTPPSVPETQAKPEETEIDFIIRSGDTSVIVGDRLVEAGIIGDKWEFHNEMVNMGLTHYINAGVYRIKKGTDIKQIINTIVKSK